MSGGAFNYNQYNIDEIIEEIEKLDFENLNFEPETILQFKEGLKFLRLARVYTQRIDWLLSGDDSEKSFHERLIEDIKKIKVPA